MKSCMKTVAVGAVLLFAATLLPAQQTASGKAGAIEYPPVYRIELVVFAHVDGRSDRTRADAPADFTDRLDPLLLARANAMAERQLSGLAGFLPVAGVPGDTDETTPWLEPEEQTLRPIPPVYSALDDLSRPIQRAFDRLIDAPEYDPVIARAWIQHAQRGRPTARVRIHDQNVADVIEPAYGQSLVPVLEMLPFGPLIETPPPALEIYRLDGTVRLRQRQFLHMDLDLVWQTRALALADSGPPAGDRVAAPGDPQSIDGQLIDGQLINNQSINNQSINDQWRLHRLRQSRIVRPGRLEYFDSSLFGVLVRIDRFEQVVPEVETAEPETTAPVTNSPEPSENTDPVTNSGG